MRIAKSKWLVFIEVFIFVLSRVAFAQSIFGEFDPIKFVFGPEVPPEWYQVNMFMQWLVFPFIGIWLVLFGILEQLGIFRVRRSIGGFLALIMALIASSSGSLVSMSRILFQVMGGWGFLAFFVVFFVGVAFWSYGELHGRYSRVKYFATQLEDDLKKVAGDISATEGAITNPRANLTKEQIEALNKKLDRLYERQKELENKRSEYRHM